MNNNVYTFQSPRSVAQNHLEKLGDLSSKLPVYAKTPVLYKTEEHDYVKAPGRHLILNTRNNQVINVVKDKFNLDYHQNYFCDTTLMLRHHLHQGLFHGQVVCS